MVNGTNVIKHVKQVFGHEIDDEEVKQYQQ